MILIEIWQIFLIIYSGLHMLRTKNGQDFFSMKSIELFFLFKNLFHKIQNENLSSFSKKKIKLTSKSDSLFILTFIIVFDSRLSNL